MHDQEDFNLGCDCNTSVGSHRILGSDTCISQYFTAVEKGVGLRVILWSGKEVEKITLIGDGHSKTSGCICRVSF